MRLDRTGESDITPDMDLERNKKEIAGSISRFKATLLVMLFPSKTVGYKVKSSQMKEFLVNPQIEENTLESDVEHYKSESHRQLNRATHFLYFSILRRIRSMTRHVLDSSYNTVIEIDNTSPVNTIRTYYFIGRHVYLYLEVDVVGTVKVEYQLNDCDKDLESYLLNRLKSIKLRGGFIEEVNQPNYNEFFERMLVDQPKNIINL